MISAETPDLLGNVSPALALSIVLSLFSAMVVLAASCWMV